MVLYTFHLFAGAGGGILADLLLGHRPIGAVEIEQYPRDVLLRHQLTGELPRFPVWDDVRSFSIDNDATRPFIERLCRIREQLCISGGFPCQDISSAGKGAGITGEKSGLWKEYSRIVREIRPRYVFLENSNLLVRRGLDVVLTDLAEMRYSMAWGIVSAADVGAPHLRKRFWGLAVRERERERDVSDRQSGRLETAGSRSSDKEGGFRPSDLRQILPNSNGARRETINARQSEQESLFRPSEIRCSLSDAGNKNNGRLYEEQEESDEQSKPDSGRKTFNVRWQRRQAESDVGGMANGISRWLDDCRNGTLWTPDEKGLARIAVDIPNRAARLKAIGNAQVPLCAAVAFTMLKEIVDNYDT